MSNTEYISEIPANSGLPALNSRIVDINTALNNLSDRIEGQTSKSAMLMYSAPLAEGVALGDIVYYDPEIKRFAKALAATLPDPGEQGETIEAPSARVAGIVVNYTDSGTITGTILTGGYWKSEDIVTHCLSSNPTAGTWYLSPTKAGTATKNPAGHLRQPVLTYYGDGKFSMALFYQAHDNHFHSTAVLSKTWYTTGDAITALLEAGYADAADIVPPSGYNWAYPVKLDPDCEGLGDIAEGVTAVFNNGLLAAPTMYLIATASGTFTRSDSNDGTGMYAWKNGSKLLYTFDAVPAIADTAYTDAHHATGTTYSITTVGAGIIEVSGYAGEFARYSAADVKSYAWAYGALLRYTWEEYPEAGLLAYSDINCSLNAETIASIQGTLFAISDNILWCKYTNRPMKGAVTLFNHFPFAYGSPVIRTVIPASDNLEVVINNGICKLNALPFVDGDTAISSRAISGISGNSLNYTPVVPEIVAGSGITATSREDGGVILSAMGMVDIPVDAYAIMHNGTTVTNDGLYQYITFPQGRTSRLIIELPFSDRNAQAEYKATVWAMTAGAGATLSCTMFFVPDPGIQAPVELPTTTTVENVPLTLDQAIGGVSYNELSTGLTISGSGTLVATLYMDSEPATDIRLLRVGFKMTTTGNTIASAQGTTVSNQGIISTGKAGAYIPKYSAVRMDSAGKIQICTSSDASYADTCIGIALNNCNIDADVSYMITGIIESSADFDALAPGSGVYIGLDGSLVGAPESGRQYTQRVGTALASGSIQVVLGAAILTE